jgi:putative SOS response-associated peptidase YedK
MCGRFSEVVQLSVLSKRFKFAPGDLPWRPRYNMSPGQDGLTVVQRETRTAMMMRWGLIPHWSKDSAIGYKMINARAETLLEKPSFRKPLMEQRCLVLADGFYEWRIDPIKKAKIPLRFVLKSREPFAFAGLWDVWKDPKGKEVTSFTIITTQANEDIRPIHERMPVILEENAEDIWLDTQVWNPVILKPLLQPLSADKIEYYPVSTVVNLTQNDSEACVQPISLV